MRAVIRSALAKPWNVIFGVVLALGAAVQTGCNLFSFAADDGQADLTYHGLILKGNEAINDGDYTRALSYFEQAQRSRPQGSEAFLYHSKAIMSAYNLDYNVLNDEFKTHRDRDTVINGTPSRVQGDKGIPFVDSTTTLAGIDSVFHPVAVSVANLEHILRGSKDTLELENGFKMYPDGDTASDGVVSQGVARLDLGLLQAVKAMLGPMDLDGNNSINDSCGVGKGNICSSAGDAACLASQPYLAKCKDGPSSEAKRFENFKQLTQYIDIESLDSKDVKARNVSTNPNDINGFLDAMQGPIAGSNYNLDSVTTVMNQNGDQKLSGQLSDMVANIKDLNNFLGYMRYNDAIDNDFDQQSPPGTAVSPMRWHDYDKTSDTGGVAYKGGGIRWDYNEAARFVGYPPGSYNFGHPVHRLLDSSIYLTFADLKVRYPELAKDSSINSRISLMIKHCREVTDSMALAGNVNTALKQLLRDRICSTYTTALKPNVARPLRSDWVTGTFGVDEEMIDDRNNDYDGIKDEDGRSARFYDDDDDARLDLGMIDSVNAGRNLTPMTWMDKNTNYCPDIDTLIPAPAAPYRMQFCVGSLQHRLYLARKALTAGGVDSLVRYYSRFNLSGETENSRGNGNCREDIGKLDPAYLAAQNPTETEMSLACHYKHIWTANRPVRSEWSAGVFGIDEEGYVDKDGQTVNQDGFDNDGDGWIDEDLK